MAVKDHTPGDVRYFTYWLYWPDGSRPWVDQTPFVNPLQFELKNTRFMKDPKIPKSVAYDLIRKGEADFVDSNKVRHRIVIESEARAREWGTKR